VQRRGRGFGRGLGLGGVVGGRWVADKGDREGKEASPGACTHAPRGLRGVWVWMSWAWIWAQRGGWGLWWGLGGVFAGVLGGEGAADKEEREGRYTSIGLHLETDLAPSVVNSARTCLV
jgi:hypothetical protein